MHHTDSKAPKGYYRIVNNLEIVGDYKSDRSIVEDMAWKKSSFNDPHYVYNSQGELLYDSSVEYKERYGETPPTKQ